MVRSYVVDTSSQKCSEIVIGERFSRARAARSTHGRDRARNTRVGEIDKVVFYLLIKFCRRGRTEVDGGRRRTAIKLSRNDCCRRRTRDFGTQSAAAISE